MNRLMMPAMILLGAAFGAGGMMLADRLAPGSLDGADKRRVELVVRDYLLANPEIIPAAMEKLQAKSAAKAVSASRGQITRAYGNAWIGNPNGDVTVVEYYDYNCGYCRASLPVLKQLVARDRNVRVVFRELPILAASSRKAARVSLAAAKQGHFRAFHEALFTGGPVSDATIAAAARRAGVDAARIPDDADEELRDNYVTAEKLGLSGTPSWVIGDQVLSGALPLDHLLDAIAAARAADRKPTA